MCKNEFENADGEMVQFKYNKWVEHWNYVSFQWQQLGHAMYIINDLQPPQALHLLNLDAWIIIEFAKLDLSLHSISTLFQYKIQTHFLLCKFRKKHKVIIKRNYSNSKFDQNVKSILILYQDKLVAHWGGFNPFASSSDTSAKFHPYSFHSLMKLYQVWTHISSSLAWSA